MFLDAGIGPNRILLGVFKGSWCQWRSWTSLKGRTRLMKYVSGKLKISKDQSPKDLKKRQRELLGLCRITWNLGENIQEAPRKIICWLIVILVKMPAVQDSCIRWIYVVFQSGPEAWPVVPHPGRWMGSSRWEGENPIRAPATMKTQLQQDPAGWPVS